MTNQPPLNPDALKWLTYIEDAIKDAGYNCDCATTPDNVSIDKDWLDYHLRELKKALLAVAQPEVNSVESIPATIQVISWEEEPEHECWKLSPDETFVGLIVKSDRAWSPADRYTLNIERPEVNDA